MDESLGRSLPLKKPSSITRLVIFIVLSVSLMMLDHRGNHLEQIRTSLSILVYPIQIIANAPTGISRWLAANLTTRSSELKKLKTDYGALKDNHLLLLAKLQKYDALIAENNRFRFLLMSAERVSDRAIVAELLDTHPDPFTRNVTIGRGTADEVYVRQPVIDAYGIMGQVTRVGIHTSIITLITDPSHAVPVQVNRNGLRTIAIGAGAQDTLSLPYLTNTEDIKEGDLLVSSGLGATFPAGYPVATVSKIINDPDEPTLRITAKPMAKLNHNREVLLIWPGKAPLEPDESLTDDAEHKK